jgi:two-component system phosphate regulon sensor histidine kinase PhoR
MPRSWRQFLTGTVAFLAAGAAVGWIYGRPELGLLAAALVALGWNIRRLFIFDRAVRARDFDALRHGDGIWQQIFSRFRYAQQRGTKHKNRYRVLLREIRKSTDAMPDGAVILDQNNEILVLNRAAKRLAGLKPRKDRGQRVDNLIRNPELTALLQSDDFSRAIDIPSPVMSTGWLNCRVVPYGADQKLLLLRDVTERLRLNKMRRDFVANASHELRTPLTVISGYLESIIEDGVAEDHEFPISQMQTAARRMNAIISELLELSRLESGGQASLDNTVDVGALMMNAKRAFAGRRDAPEILLEIKSSALLRGNAGQLESVVTNLLSNALRHTPADGTVTLRFESNKKRAVLSVIDTGEGIAGEDIPRVTERFFRVDRGRAREDGGVGIGLAIVKHILGRHDAELVIQSRVGEGSEFRCVFPASRVTSKSTLEVATATG